MCNASQIGLFEGIRNAIYIYRTVAPLFGVKVQAIDPLLYMQWTLPCFSPKSCLSYPTLATGGQAPTASHRLRVFNVGQAFSSFKRYRGCGLLVPKKKSPYIFPLAFTKNIISLELSHPGSWWITTIKPLTLWKQLFTTTFNNYPLFIVFLFFFFSCFFLSWFNRIMDGLILSWK